MSLWFGDEPNQLSGTALFIIAAAAGVTSPAILVVLLGQPAALAA